ncbi:hypothetical protein [Photobacterium kasasachensis]|uniref:hypothetical protein n=1 Tax=Photobacterium kasasachensis TaxID=2910240 RepID=UPI003D0CB5E0
MPIYCIYSDKFVEESELTREHIIPLSMGGMDGFEILVEREANKRIGSKIDGKVANDPFIALDRKNAQVKGHSGKLAQPVWKNVRVGEENEPLQIRFNAPGDTEHWCPKKRAVVDTASLAGKRAQIQLQIDKITPLIFLAKVALAAGYHVYGETFRKNVDIVSLQQLISADENKRKDVLLSSNLRFVDRFLQEEKDAGDIFLFTEIGALKSCSTVTLMQCQDNFIISVSILGKFLGSVNVEARMDDFPYEGLHRQGHVVFLDRENGIETMSFYDAVCLVGEKHGIYP